MLRKIFLPALLITAVGSAFFIPFLGAAHLFDWDEINFAESAREMIVTGNYSRVQIDFQPFWEKPPLFFWLQAAGMKAFGINEFAARFPNAITGIATLLTFFFIGRRITDTRLGVCWSLCMLGSFLPHLYFKSGIIDPVFNFFIFLGVYHTIQLISRHEKPRSGKYAVWAGIFIGLATLTKGPVALLIEILCVLVYWICIRFTTIVRLRQVLLFIFSFIAVAGVWIIIDVRENGLAFLQQFLSYQVQLLTQPVAGHGGPIYYHFVIVFIGCFPMSVIALPALIKNYHEKSPLDMKRWMLILFWVVMILFTIVKTKIVHYSSLTYFPLSFLAATVIYQALNKEKGFPKWILVLLAVIGSIFSLILTAIPWLAAHKEFLLPHLRDQFAVDCLSAEVNWSGSEIFIGMFYFLFVLVSVILLWKKYVKAGVTLLFGATACCLFIYLKSVVPGIEAYSQGPAIKFYESLQGQHAYVATIGFKSYAPYFYFRKPPGDDPQTHSTDWLLHAPLDRPAYFVVKTTSMNSMQEYPDVKFLMRDGGFAFYARYPSTQE